MTWANTAWGTVCAALHAYLLPEYPDLILGIGPDDFTLHEARTRVLFLGPGMTVRTQTINISVPDETLEPIVRGARLGQRGLWNRVCPILCRIAVPFSGSESSPDASPQVCENLYERFLAGLNQIAHVRASSPTSAKWAGSSIGKYGTSVDVSFSLRFVVTDKRLATTTPTSSELTGISASDPAGQTVETMVPGDG